MDGLDELPEDEQDKIKRAIEQGHVDDEDWQHVCSDVVLACTGCLPFAGPLTECSRRKGVQESCPEEVQGEKKTHIILPISGSSISVLRGKLLENVCCQRIDMIQPSSYLRVDFTDRCIEDGGGGRGRCC